MSTLFILQVIFEQCCAMLSINPMRVIQDTYVLWSVHTIVSRRGHLTEMHSKTPDLDVPPPPTTPGDASQMSTIVYD